MNPREQRRIELQSQYAANSAEFFRKYSHALRLRRRTGSRPMSVSSIIENVIDAEERERLSITTASALVAEA
jgi:hypothetical protein